MNHEQLAKKAPAIFAQKPHAKVSENYTFVPTVDVISAFEQMGFEPIFAKQQRVRDASRKETCKHTVLLQHRDEKVRDIFGKMLPTLRIINSHDWSSTLQVYFGMLRLVCQNGLMFAGEQFAQYIVRHDSVIEDSRAIAGRFQSAVGRMYSVAEQWAGIILPDEKAKEFALGAAVLRFGEERATLSLADVLLATRRKEDESRDLWTLFNVVQENVTKGGVKDPNREGARNSRELVNIEEERRVNVELFELAMQYAR